MGLSFQVSKCPQRHGCVHWIVCTEAGVSELMRVWQRLCICPLRVLLHTLSISCFSCHSAAAEQVRVCASLLVLFSACVGICNVCTSVSAASAEACSLHCPCDGTNKVRLCDRSAACLRMRCVHNTRVLCCVLSRVCVSCVLLSLWLLHLLCVK